LVTSFLLLTITLPKQWKSEIKKS